MRKACLTAGSRLTKAAPVQAVALPNGGTMGGEDGEREATDPVSRVSLKTCPSSLGTGTIALISSKFNLDLLLYKAFVVC